MSLAKMKMLKQMTRHMRKDKIQNDCIWKEVDVALIEKKIDGNLANWACAKKTTKGSNKKS